MTTGQTLGIAIVAGAAIAALLYAFWVFDRLVREEYRQHRQAWLADGCPGGFLWQAPECTWWRSGLAVLRLSWVWLFRTPSWAQESGTLRARFWQLRVCVLIWNATIIGLMIFVIIAWNRHAA